jgi:hypothetical protein
MPILVRRVVDFKVVAGLEQKLGWKEKGGLAVFPATCVSGCMGPLHLRRDG